MQSADPVIHFFSDSLYIAMKFLAVYPTSEITIADLNTLEGIGDYYTSPTAGNQNLFIPIITAVPLLVTYLLEYGEAYLHLLHFEQVMFQLQSIKSINVRNICQGICDKAYHTLFKTHMVAIYCLPLHYKVIDFTAFTAEKIVSPMVVLKNVFINTFGVSPDATGPIMEWTKQRTSMAIERNFLQALINNGVGGNFDQDFTQMKHAKVNANDPSVTMTVNLARERFKIALDYPDLRQKIVDRAAVTMLHADIYNRIINSLKIIDHGNINLQ